MKTFRKTNPSEHPKKPLKFNMPCKHFIDLQVYKPLDSSPIPNKPVSAWLPPPRNNNLI